MSATGRRLRVAMVWSQTLHAEHVLEEPTRVVLGAGSDALFPLPETHALRGDVTLLTPLADATYTLHLAPEARGAVWLAGERHEVSELLGTRASLTLDEGDYGVVSLGAASYFFQHVELPSPAPRALGWLDVDALLSFGLSLFLHGFVLVLMLLAYRALPREQTLSVRPELLRRYLVTPVVPEPTPPRKEARTTPTPAPSTRRRAREADAPSRRERARRSEPGPQAAPDAVTDKVRGMGVLGAIAGSGALDRALAGDQVGALLGALETAQPDVAVDRRGGLRGSARAGAGDGALLGGGALATGPTGAPRGAGRAGAQGDGSGAGRGRGELQVQVTPGAPEVSGYLSADQINRVVRANQAALRYCYETEVQRQRGLRGKVAVQWRVDRTGAVASARIASSTLGNASVEGCLVRQVKKWRFPKPDGGEVSVTYPFLFGVGG